MYRYVCIVILTGGKSVRMGFCKSFFLLNGVSFLDKSLRLCFDVGFVDIFIGGFSKAYSSVLDISISSGPVSSFFSVMFHKRLVFSKCIFISIDTPFLNIKSIVRCIFFSTCLQSCYYNGSLFPLSLVFSDNVYFFLKFLCGVKTKPLYSVSRLMYFFLKRDFVVFSFDKQTIINVNRCSDIFLKK